MRALTLIQPMAWAIVSGTKRIENRPTRLPKDMRHRETCVAIHAGKKWSDEYARIVMDVMGLDEMPEAARWQGIVGAAVFLGHSIEGAMDRDPWYSGPYGHVIGRAAALTLPIPCQGMLGWWPVPPDVAEAVGVGLAESTWGYG